MDCYDFARRAEFLGIGRWGNRLASASSENTNKLCDAKELADVLIDVVVGGRWSVYAEKAKELAKVCGGPEMGRKAAARMILSQIDEYVEDNADGRSRDNEER